MGHHDYELEEFKRAYDMLDRDHEGGITAKEIGTFLRCLGKDPTDMELQLMVCEVDTDGNGTIDFEEFVDAMTLKMSVVPDDDELREAFRIFDKENTGYIGIDQLRSVMIAINQKLADDELEDMIREGDRDNDGMLSYEEFVQMMTTK